MVLAGHEMEVPGYMVLAAVVYAALGTAATWAVGRPMTAINNRRNDAESDHRFALVRLRENSEGVALIRGEADEERALGRGFGRVSGVMLGLNRVERHLMGLTSAYGMITHIFPILVASPRYFAGAISLGVLMQVGAAFAEVTKALTWLMTNYPKVADWVSHVERVVELEDSLDAAARLGRRGAVTVEEGPAADGTEVVAFEGLSVAAPDGRLLVRRADAVIRPGERVLIQGESGTGKSTLFRAMAGAWPWGAGRIRVPERGAAMFMPQRPYLPLGTLAAALAYPAQAASFPEAAMVAALARCGLGRLSERLGEEARWDRILSLGEQQRLAFARVLLHRPRWIFMDEATAALDEANQDGMMRLLEEALPSSALVSIGHRPGLERYHDRVLTLQASPGGRGARRGGGDAAADAARMPELGHGGLRRPAALAEPAPGRAAGGPSQAGASTARRRHLAAGAAGGRGRPPLAQRRRDGAERGARPRPARPAPAARRHRAAPAPPSQPRRRGPPHGQRRADSACSRPA